MAILIVDDESSTRTALRDLLTQLGHKTILEAKNGEEGLKTAIAEKNRIRMIVADWEMPYMDGITMMDRIAELPELDLAPFLLITSDLPRSKLAELQARTNRLDAFLIKPFRMKALSQAMLLAQKHRASTRDTVIVFEGSTSPTELIEAVKQPKMQLSGWRSVIVVKTVPEIQEAVLANHRRLGGLVLDPSRPVAGLSEWLVQFSRTPLGSSTSVVCMSRDAGHILPFRMQCQFFVPPLSTSTSWCGTLSRIRDRMESSLETELLFQELKAALQQKDTAAGIKIVERILELDPVHSEAQSVLGDLLENQGKRSEAIKQYRNAIESNPCQPRPYIRLLDILPAQDTALRAEIAENAARFCPQNQDALLAAARSWKIAGNQAQALVIAQRILTLNPKNLEAIALAGPST